ncbi:hypothetical protein MRX96_046946 [Rhipicephalus microplus]
MPGAVHSPSVPTRDYHDGRRERGVDFTPAAEWAQCAFSATKKSSARCSLLSRSNPLPRPQRHPAAANPRSFHSPEKPSTPSLPSLSGPAGSERSLTRPLRGRREASLRAATREATNCVLMGRRVSDVAAINDHAPPITWAAEY